MDINLKDLNDLGDDQFEKLIKTLLLSVIGPGVTPFTKGKDGAREATFNGKAPYPSKTEIWNGGWIFQVKYADTNLGIDKARNQIQYLIDGELSKLKKYGFLSDGGCDNYIYITNVSFTGTANTGLHDYINKKKEEYKLKNFHYWDGEKVMAFVNTFENVRQTFFPVPGLQFVDQSELKSLEKVFVKPLQYDQLKKILKKEKIVNIIGQPHVGKSSLALILSNEICEELNLNNTFLIPLIDNLQSIPKIENSAVIFDDLFGDINYEVIGKKTKVINTLLLNNYIVITSRDYIFQEAEKKNEVIHNLSITPVIIQEGSYTNEQLTEILMNHCHVHFEKGIISKNTLSFIETHTNTVITKIRFPHNLQFFVESLDYEVTTKEKLNDIIQNSIQIESVIRQWLLGQTDATKNVLMLLSIGKFTIKNEILEICKKQWGYQEDQIDECLSQSKRILKSGEFIKFIHPSYKSSILNTFLQGENSKIIPLFLDILKNARRSIIKKVYRNVVSKIFSQLEVEEILGLIGNENIRKVENTLLWYNLLIKDQGFAMNYFLKFWNKERGRAGDRQYSSFIGMKEYMNGKEVLKFIDYLFMKRNLAKNLIDNLIVVFSFKIRERLTSFLKNLDDDNEEIFKLKIRLLGVIGSKYPEQVFDQLVQFEQKSILKNKKLIYEALNALHHSYKSTVKKTFIQLLKTEENFANRHKIERSLKGLARIE